MLARAALGAIIKGAAKSAAKKVVTKKTAKVAEKAVAKKVISKADKMAAIGKGERKTEARIDKRAEAKPDKLAERACQTPSNRQDSIKHDATRKAAADKKADKFSKSGNSF